MEEASISDSPSALTPRITDLTSSGNGTASNCDEPSLAGEISLPLSPMENEIIADSHTLCAFIAEDMQEASHLASIGTSKEESSCSDAQEIQKPLPSSGETAEIVAENLSPADSETIRAVLGEVTREIEANGKPKDESSGFGKLSDEIGTGRGGLGEVTQEIEAGDAANGKPKEESSGGLAVGGRFGCSLEFEFIDDTAVIGLSKIGGGDLLDTAGRKNGKMESEAKKDKKPRRRSKAAKKVAGETQNCSSLKVSTGNSTGYKRTEKGTKIVYSVKEMETLRYRNVKGQRKMWQEVYNSLSPTARTEYDELGGFRHQNNQSGLTWDTSRAPGVLGELCKGTVEGGLETPTPAECTYGYNYSGENDKYSYTEYVEDEDSDDSFSIQRRAFLVEGEPDFDAGPPEDGLEYLRRVRWEASQIPNFKVAKLDKSKLNKEQSIYMPEIPEIERCPEHLLPLKEWEEEFLSDFSELRLAISHLDCSDNLGPVIVESTSNPDDPTLSSILKMDLVTRISMLKRRIVLFENKDELSRNDGVWLFALCAAIDTPLDADTSAVLRGLLRKCSKLRAGKSELDDEAIMLNIMVLIAGKYFGQAENST